MEGSTQPGGRQRSARRGRGSLQGRLAGGFGTPWVRAPLLLLRYPGTLLAIATAVVILAVVGASSPLFLSSAGNAALQEGIAATCPWAVGTSLSTSAGLVGAGFSGQESALGLFQSTDRGFKEAAARIPHLGTVELQIVGTTVMASLRKGRSPNDSVRLYMRDRALGRLQRLESAGGSGVWLPHTTARILGVNAGDTIRLAGADRAVRVRVATIYRDLATIPRSNYWCGQEHLIYPLSAFENFIPPPLVFADRDTFISVSQRLGERAAVFTWELPIDPRGLTIQEGRAVDGALAAVKSNFSRSLFSLGSTSSIQSSFGFLLQRAESTQASLRGSVTSVSLAGRLVALVVVAGAGVYWLHRRRTEVALLSARGVGPLGVAAKTILEALPVAIVASGGGWAAGIWMVKLLGPSGLFERGAEGDALIQVAWTSAAGVVLFALVAGVAARRENEPADVRTRGVLSSAPWELVALALAGASVYEILTHGPPRSVDVNNPPKLDVLILLFPILFVSGAAGLAARALRRLQPRLRSTGRSWPVSGYLAGRRLAGAPKIALALLTATALSVGILSYAGALTSTVRATTEAKAKVFTGSDLAVQLAEDTNIPASIASRATKVLQVDRAFLQPQQESVEVLGVDRETFARGAYWDRSFAKRPLDDLLGQLAPSAGVFDPVPVLVVGPGLPASEGTLTFRFGAAKVPVRVVGTMEAFPSMAPTTPLVVVDLDALTGRDVHGVTAIWVRGDPNAAMRALASVDAHILSTVTADQVEGTQSFRSLSWSFGFLQALGILTGLIVLGGMLLYLEARQRGRAISYALASRMGLDRRSHRTSVGLELGALLAVGCVLGIALAWIAARFVYGQLDPFPQLPPGPLFRLPITAFGLTLVAVAIASWVGAWKVQRATERTKVAEVIRLAG